MRKKRKRVAGYGVELRRRPPIRLLAHPDAPGTEQWHQWARGQDRPRAVDLFAGCGGLGLGLEQAGFSVVLSVDRDPWAIETHRHNLPGPILDFDLSVEDRVESLLKLLAPIPLDLVAGGPPCQPFSRAGRSKIRSLVQGGSRAAVDERKDLWRVFLRVVERLRPRAVLMENVPDMALGDDMARIRTMVTALERIGYEAHVTLLDAWRHGVPQHRQRLFLVATLEGRPFTWPRADDKPVTVSDAIADLPRLGEGLGESEMAYSGPKSAFQRRARRGVSTMVIWDHVTRPVRDDDRRAFNLMAPGTRYSELPDKLRRYRADIFEDKYNRLPWDSLSRSITAHIAKDGYWYIHPEEARTLTVREAARLQTFPDCFRFAGTRSHAFAQIGNAVPPVLARAIGAALLKALRSAPVPEDQRLSRHIETARGQVLQWSRRAAADKPWRHPGAGPWSVLLGVLVDRRGGAGDEVLRQVLKVCPTPADTTAERLSVADTRQGKGLTSKTRSRILRVAEVVARQDGWSADWHKIAKLGPADAAFVRAVGLGQERILVTSQALRVAERFTRDPACRKRGLSCGKLVLGRLLGSGATFAALNAGLTALGATMCTERNPRCRECPLRASCATGARKVRASPVVTAQPHA